MGQPTKLTAERQDKIVAALRAGNYLAVAAEYAGVGRSTVHRWLQEADEPGASQAKVDFRDAVTRARAEAETRMVAIVNRAASGGAVLRRTTRTLADGTQEVEESYAAPDGRVALEFLGRAHPERWARTGRVELTGAEGGPIQVQSETLVVHAERIHERLAGQRGLASVRELPTGDGPEEA